MYAHSCITTFLLCNVSLDGIASAEADRKVVRNLAYRDESIFSTVAGRCKFRYFMPEFAAIDKRSQSVENGQCKKRCFGFPHVGHLCASMDTRVCACIYIRVSRDVILTTLVKARYSMQRYVAIQQTPGIVGAIDRIRS